MYKHLIFDLDGTVADTLPCIIDAINYTLRYFKVPYQYQEKDGCNLIGYGTPYLVKKAFKDENCDVDKIVKIYIPIQRDIHIKHVKRFPVLISVLKQLKKRGYKLYIATNKPIEVGVPTIKKLYGSNFFTDEVYQLHKTPKKPDPYVVNQIINHNHLKKNECLYIGDSEVDLITAKNAGIDSMLVKWGYGKYGKFNEKLAKFVIKSPKELLNYLK